MSPRALVRSGLSVCVALLIFALPGATRAQSLPPDVVELANGGIVRGTIVENIPGDHVTIQLVTGEIRTFAAAEVTRAGSASPAQAISAVPPPPETVLPPPVMTPAGPVRARLMVESNTDQFVLHRVTGTATVRGYRRTIDAFELICSIPCRVQLDEGTYYFAISRGTGMPRRLPTPFVVQGDTTLTLEYESRSEQRLIGALVIGGGLLVGGGILAASLYEYFVGQGYREINEELAIAGMITSGVIMIGASIAGSYFAAMRDHIDLRTGSLRF